MIEFVTLKRKEKGGGRVMVGRRPINHSEAPLMFNLDAVSFKSMQSETCKDAFFFRLA